MPSSEESVKTARLKLEAYGRARPIAENLRDEPLALQALVEVAWELLGEHGRYTEITQLIQDGLNHVTLGFQKLEAQAVQDAGTVGTPRLVVSWNETAGTAACGVCGNPDMNTHAGPELFLEGKSDPVCERCAAKYSPELAGLMRLFHKNSAFRAALQELRNDSLSPSPGEDTQLKMQKIGKKFDEF